MQESVGGDLSPPPQQQQQQAAQASQWPPYAQQQWMAGMPYPAAAMAMMQHQHQMMMMYMTPGAYYHPQQHQYHQHLQNGVGFRGGSQEARTVWVGDLLHWMDETYLHSCFNENNQVISVKVIRNRQTGQSEGYGFVEFYSHEAAVAVLQNYHGAPMPNSDQSFRLNWASFAGDRRAEGGSELSVFVGDLASDVTDDLLQETFAGKYPSVRGAKVVVDSISGRSKGYGFVRFGDEDERSRAIAEMNGVYCSSRPMRVSAATPKKSPSYQQQQFSSQAVVLAGGHEDLSNTTIFVGGIDSDVGDEDIRQPFCQFGEITSVKIPPGKGCAFVQYASRKDAEEALENLDGTVIGNHSVRLSWGRNPANKQWRVEHNHQWNG